MPLPAILYALGSAPLFAARPFLAALVTALLARFGERLPWLGESRMVETLAQTPDWFQSSWTLGILGVLAALEIASAKSSEARALLDEVDVWLKSAIALGVSLAVLDTQDARVLETIQQQSVLGSIAALGVAGSVLALAKLRQGFVGIVSDVDDHDDIGLQSLLAWAENVWTVFGLLFLVILPIAALVLAALTTLGIYLFQKRAERLEEESKVPCAACGARLLPHATRCASCGAPQSSPRRVGVFGQPKREIATDMARQRFDLAARKRCPDCASRLRERAVQQRCATCGRVTFEDQAEFERYLAALAERLPRTLLISFLLSAIPLVGVVPGVVYFRLNLIAGLRGYVPPLRGIAARWITRLVGWVLILLQPIPILGALMLPLMCWTNYAIYRRALRGRASADLAPGEASQPGGAVQPA